jgi:hypothetical protein
MERTRKYFEYNGVQSILHNLVLCSFEQIEEYVLGLDREIQKGNMTKFRTKVNHFGTCYSGTLAFNVSIMKDPCMFSSQQDLSFTRKEIRKITSWLTSPSTPKLFHIIENEYSSDFESIDYFGVISSLNTTSVNGQVVGFTFTLNCNAAFGYSQEYSYLIESETEKTITIDNTSDELEGYVFPILNITPNETGTIKIRNNTEKKEMQINVEEKNQITIDCERCLISNQSNNINFEDLGWSNYGEIYLFRLVSGENEIKITGNCSVTIKCRYPRKVGNV